MSIILATPTQLAHYLDPDADPTPDPPSNATILLRYASVLVLDASSGSLYDVNETTQLATDTATAQALADATCEQAQAWSLNGIDPRRGPQQAPRVVASKAIAGVSTSYVAQPGSDGYLTDLARADSLTSAAWQILSENGLTSNGVSTGSYGREYALTPRTPFRLGPGQLGGL